MDGACFRGAQKEIRAISQARIQLRKGITIMSRKGGTFMQKLPGILFSVSLKFLAAQGKSLGDGVFDRFAVMEWISLGCLFSG